MTATPPTTVSIDMTGKVAVVTGGGYGMGRASARRFAACGASVVIADVDVAHGRETEQLISAAGGTALFVEADVSVEADVRRLFETTVGTYGGLDYAHNNAGIIEAQVKVARYPLEQWDRILRNNLTSVLLCMQQEIPLMIERGGGAIVNVASETTYKGNAGDAGYTASKHGVYGLTTVAALEYISRGIRVNAIAPGNVETGIVERARASASPEMIEWIETVQPNKRLGQPEEIAELVIWLCSDAAVLVNGAKIAADAGWHIT
ncbi:MAG TPA: SDR family oxidoreductase [Mycobacteriales bacterium]|jgi:NAD(P)-dependent dehydrogenase (short-subunit alcohol dehydrogenase family)|nr:SDR family oxidoreductase [Mycobacteriales bacterium]